MACSAHAEGRLCGGRSYLQSQAAKLGIDKLLDADEVARLYGSPFENSRSPDFVAITKPGLIYTSGTKLAEHGGFAQDDRNVALLVAHPSLRSKVFKDEVETRQIAPTILGALGIDSRELKSVRVRAHPSATRFRRLMYAGKDSDTTRRPDAFGRLILLKRHIVRSYRFG